MFPLTVNVFAFYPLCVSVLVSSPPISTLFILLVACFFSSLYLWLIWRKGTPLDFGICASCCSEFYISPAVVTYVQVIRLDCNLKKGV